MRNALRQVLTAARDRPVVNLVLLLLTLCTTAWTFYVVFTGSAGSSADAVMSSATFAVALVVILGTHEMGHYLLARMHRVNTSLPYFIPMPGLGVGTLGAVIHIRDRIPNRNALIDIGAAGPLAGLAIAIPILVVGMARSRIGAAGQVPTLFPGDTSLWVFVPELARALSDWARGAPPVELAQEGSRYAWVFGDNLLLWGVERLVHGELPAGQQVYAHPLVVAGWFGCLVTMLNLIPIGQLDGGHVVYALLGARAALVGKAAAWALFGLCVFWSAGWLLWLLVTVKLIRFSHPEVVDPVAPITRGRKVVSALCLVALILCVMPVPITQVVM